MGGFSPLLIGGRARGAGLYVLGVPCVVGFSPLLIGGRARGGGEMRQPIRYPMFQSPSHRGPRARPIHCSIYSPPFASFSPLLIGGRARGWKSKSFSTPNRTFQSPSHRGPRARLSVSAMAGIVLGRFQSPSHRGPRARLWILDGLPSGQNIVSAPF